MINTQFDDAISRTDGVWDPPVPAVNSCVGLTDGNCII